MNYRQIFLLVLLLAGVQAQAQKNVIQFKVVYKSKPIGTIVATEEIKGSQIIHDIQSKTDAKIMVFSIHVESDMKTIKGDNVLIEGTAFRQASRGSEDVHASTKRLGSKKYERERNGKKSVFTNEEITFCVSDLYFSEPKGLVRIYSNMYADMLPLKNLGNGRYELVTPNDRNSVYTYREGKLVKVESSTPAGQVVATRV